MKLKRSRLLAILVSSLLAGFGFSAAAQTSTNSESFAGTWQAKFQDKVFFTLQLQSDAGKLSGTASHAATQTGKNGELTSADAKAGSDRIVGSKVLDEHTLRFTTLEDDTQATAQFELKLTGANQAEIQLLSTPQGATAPKPWTLERTSTPGSSTQNETQNKPQDIKSKLAAAAQTWLAGQFGPNASNSGGSASGGSSSAVSSAASKDTPTVGLEISKAPLDAELRKDIDGLPRRVNDQFNNLGDMVNFVLIGSEAQVQAALEAADWHLADTDDRRAVLNAVMQTYDKKDYLAMPMSSLYLFGRRQDFGYEMADPYAMVASRHHFRIWKAPFAWKGQTVWVGAGTHDIGFEKDVRNGKVTHKIDPAVDGERENIGGSLQKAEKTAMLSYYFPPGAVQEAKNATGGGYHSDGRILVVELK